QQFRGKPNLRFARHPLQISAQRIRGYSPPRHVPECPEMSRNVPKCPEMSRNTCCPDFMNTNTIDQSKAANEARVITAPPGAVTGWPCFEPRTQGIAHGGLLWSDSVAWNISTRHQV